MKQYRHHGLMYQESLVLHNCQRDIFLKQHSVMLSECIRLVPLLNNWFGPVRCSYIFLRVNCVVLVGLMIKMFVYS